MTIAIFWAIALMKETANTSVTLVNFYQITQRNNPEDSHLHRPDEGDSKHLCNVGKLLPDYTAQQPRRQPSSECFSLF
jgi:hypothetical protein